MSEFSPRMGWPYPSRDDDPWYDPFVDFIQASDGSAFAAREDRSVIWSGGGTLSWTAASGTLTWTDTISVYSPLGGRLLQVAAGSVAGWIEGEVLYLPLVRQPAATTSVSLVKASHVPSDDNAMALAVRVGMSIFFRTGISLGNGDSVVGVAPIAGGAATDPNAIHENVAGEISGIAPKGSPTGADRLLIEDAADGDNKKSVLISNLPAMTPATHNIGGSAHSSSTLLQFNAKISDATLDDSSAPRTPTSHGTSHESGGGDAIKLDDLAAPDDNTDLDSTTGAHGLLPKLGGGTTNFLRADGSWAAPSGGAPLSNTAPVDVDPQAASAGVASEASRQDHKHDIVTAAAGATTPGDAAAEGTANSLARSDHQHSLANFGTGAGTFCEGNDSRLSDARTPTSHASTHEPGGGDAMTVDAAAATGSLRTLGTGAAQACAGNDSRLSDARTPTSHNTSHQSGGGDAIKLDDLAAPDDNTDLDATVSAHGLLPKLGGGTTNYLRADGTWAAPPGGGGGDATSLQGTDIDAGLAPTDGQVLTYDGTGTQWIAASPAEGTSYLEMGQNHTITSAGGSPDSEDVGRAIFDASQHNSITFRAILNSAYATTGSSSVKLYDDGSLTTPGTPRLVATFTQTDDTLTYEVFEQALTVVASGAGTNEILGEPRVYRAVVEITATSSDTTTVSTVGFAAVGNGDVVTLSADMVQAIAMSLNA
jgi:hypothetical protein